VIVFIVLSLATVLGGAASWLDGPLRPWFITPGVPPGGGVVASGQRDCLPSVPVTAATEAIERAGWRPFQIFGRSIGRSGVVVLGGLRGLTADCAPAEFQIFVFVADRYSGTLSPSVMTTGRDGVIGMIRVLPNDILTAEFARYATGDSECCPSGRVRVTYAVDRTGSTPRVTPTDRKVLRESRVTPTDRKVLPE
jgi:hypothetical protein